MFDCLGKMQYNSQMDNNYNRLSSFKCAYLSMHRDERFYPFFPLLRLALSLAKIASCSVSPAALHQAINEHEWIGCIEFDPKSKVTESISDVQSSSCAFSSLVLMVTRCRSSFVIAFRIGMAMTSTNSLILEDLVVTDIVRTSMTP